MTLLSFENVTKRFPAGRDELVVLDDVSMEVHEGDFVGIHGLRRTGKSILLRIAAGWERPDAGRVTFAGEDLWKLSDGARSKRRRGGGIGLASGAWHPNGNKPAVRHIQETLACDRVGLREAREPALRALERVGLSHCAYAPSETLSPGELIRLGLAQRLAHRPRVLLIDEPAVLLRPGEAAELYELLESIGRDRSLALIVASEDLAAIRSTQRRFSLDDGRLLEMGRSAGQVLAFPDLRTAAAKHQSS